MRIAPWNIVYVAGFIAMLRIRAPVYRRIRHNEKALVRAGALEVRLNHTLVPSALLLALVYVFTPWLSFADYHLPTLSPWCGAALLAVAIWLFHRAHADLGLNFSAELELRRGHELIQRGVYRSIRHPMYACFWLLFLAQGLLLENWLAGWYGVLAFGVMYFVRVPREEQMLCESFGEEYRDYMRRTGRVFPRIHVKHGG